MALNEATVRPIVEQWSATSESVWSEVEIDDVVAAIIGLSEVEMPHFVTDVAITANRRLVITWSMLRRQ